MRACLEECVQHGDELQLRQEPTRTLPLAILHTHTHARLISHDERRETCAKSLGLTRKGMKADRVPLSDAVRMAEVSSARIHRPGSKASGSSQ